MERKIQPSTDKGNPKLPSKTVPDATQALKAKLPFGCSTRSNVKNKTSPVAAATIKMDNAKKSFRFPSKAEMNKSKLAADATQKKEIPNALVGSVRTVAVKRGITKTVITTATKDVKAKVVLGDSNKGSNEPAILVADTTAANPKIPDEVDDNAPVKSNDANPNPNTTNEIGIFSVKKSWRKKSWQLSDFELGKRVGYGQYGSVRIAREIKSKVNVALKYIDQRIIQDERDRKRLFQEIDNQEMMKHNHIVKLFSWFFDEYRVYLIIEYAKGGALSTRLAKAIRFAEKTSAFYIVQVTNALKYCHSKDIIHRDIKPENILIDSNGNLKLADFGASVLTSSKRLTKCGTSGFMAPEMITHDPHDKSVDYWAVGVLCYELLVGENPFDADTRAEMEEKTINRQFIFPEWVSNEAQDLIDNLIVIRPSKRSNLDQILAHEWTVENLAKWKPIQLVPDDYS